MVRPRSLRSPTFSTGVASRAQPCCSGSTAPPMASGSGLGSSGATPTCQMMIITVGAGEQIAKVLPELGTLLSRPLVTLERVRVCKIDGRLLAQPTALPSSDQHGLGLWQKLMVYTSEQARYRNSPLHVALLRRLRGSGAIGATCLRGIWGFHGDRAPQGDRLLQLRRHVPVVTIVVDTPEGIARSFQIVDEVTGQAGLVTSEMVPALAAVADDGSGARRAAAGSPPLLTEP